MILNELFDNAVAVTTVTKGNGKDHYTFKTPNGLDGNIMFVYDDIEPKILIEEYLEGINSTMMDGDRIAPEYKEKLLAGAWKLKDENTTMDIVFTVDGSTNKTGKGEAHSIFATVVKQARLAVKEHSPLVISFSGAGKSRKKLYSSMARVLAHGYKMGVDEGYKFYLYSPEFMKTIRELNHE